MKLSPKRKKSDIDLSSKDSNPTLTKKRARPERDFYANLDGISDNFEEKSEPSNKLSSFEQVIEECMYQGQTLRGPYFKLPSFLLGVTYAKIYLSLIMFFNIKVRDAVLSIFKEGGATDKFEHCDWVVTIFLPYSFCSVFTNSRFFDKHPYFNDLVIKIDVQPNLRKKGN